MSSESTPSTTKATEWIDLEQCSPLAQGQSRHVYDHPHYPDRLIKVISPEKRARMLRKTLLRPSRRRYRALRGTLVELQEYIALLARNDTLPEFLPRFFGFVDTSRGPGQIVEKICLYRKELAPALSNWRDNGLRETEVVDMIDHLLGQIEQAGMMASDLSAENIVISRQPELRLVVVDGFGGNMHWRILTALVPKLSGVYRNRIRKRLLKAVGIC